MFRELCSMNIDGVTEKAQAFQLSYDVQRLARGLRKAARLSSNGLSPRQAG
jgi:hypothetical protein